MAVYWIDPYLESSGQTSGIHGTTGSGQGTYAEPWKWSQLYQQAGANVYGTVANGDEIRVKGQTFGSYTFTSHNWTSITTGSQGGVTWVRRYNTGWHSDSLQYALRLTTGEKIWKCIVEIPSGDASEIQLNLEIEDIIGNIPFDFLPKLSATNC